MPGTQYNEGSKVYKMSQVWTYQQGCINPDLHVKEPMLTSQLKTNTR